MFISSTYTITVLHYTYGLAALGAAFVSFFYVQNYWVTPDIWVGHLQYSRCWLPLPRELLGYTEHMGARPYVQPMLVTSA